VSDSELSAVWQASQTRLASMAPASGFGFDRRATKRSFWHDAAGIDLDRENVELAARTRKR
jgi:hypothetical protein